MTWSSSNLRLLSVDVAQHAPVVVLHGVDGKRGLRQIGLRILECDLELLRIEPVQHLSDGHMLVVADVNVLHDAGDIGGNTDLVGIDIGVVSRHHRAAGDVPIGAGEQHDRQHRE